MNLSELYGMEAASIGGRKKGYVLGVTADGDELCRLVCCDGAERRFFVAFDDFAVCGGKALFGEETKGERKAVSVRLGKAAYGENGKFLGFLKDYICDGKKLKYACIGEKKYPVGRLRVGDAVIVKSKREYDGNAAKDMFISAVINRTAP